jgi:DNA-binding MarR family transcriptional regulator
MDKMTYRLHDSLGFRLSRAARIQERRLDQSLKQLGLTRITWCVLLAVGNENLRQPSDIAAFVGVDRTATSRALRQMEAASLIGRTASQEDGRKRAVILTSKGEDCLRQGTPLAVANNAAMLERLGKADDDQMKGLLDRLIEGAPALPKL